jgi:glycosyltransferase involved in cell wall biosynthesis
MRQIRRLAARDPRIEIVEAYVEQSALWRMMRDADCILSTHRAEGFGYIPAHALALARPLVTTDYGGPRDFCTAETSFPVAAELTSVPRGHSLYFQPGSRWADVAPAAVAEALKKVYDGPENAFARARCGQALMTRTYTMAAYAARCEDRLHQIGAL